MYNGKVIGGKVKQGIKVSTIYFEFISLRFLYRHRRMMGQYHPRILGYGHIRVPIEITEFTNH